LKSVALHHAGSSRDSVNFAIPMARIADESDIIGQLFANRFPDPVKEDPGKVAPDGGTVASVEETNDSKLQTEQYLTEQEALTALQLAGNNSDQLRLLGVKYAGTAAAKTAKALLGRIEELENSSLESLLGSVETSWKQAAVSNSESGYEEFTRRLTTILNDTTDSNTRQALFSYTPSPELP
jgi:hypothetical protein